MLTNRVGWVARAAVLALVLASLGVTACATPPAPPKQLGWRSALAQGQRQDTPDTAVDAGRSPGVVAGPALPAAQPDAPAAESATEQIIRDVIERGNLAQAAAISGRDQSVMAATSTERYFQELAGINQHLLDGGVIAIKLVNLEWGAVAVDAGGTTATATTYETWRTTFADGTTDEARDRNDYRLVRDRTGWRIDADDHPGDGPRAPGTAPSGQAVPPPDEPPAPAPEIPRDRDSTSTNWSGYAATGGTFTAVSGTWTVSRAPVDGAFGASATWVGIGGVRGRDLIQAGTQVTVSGAGRARYRAWIETLPQASRPVALAVAPGDSVTVSVDESGANTWLVTLTNNSTGQSYQETVPYVSSHSSAEWVQEAPSAGRRGIVPLDDFGAVQFTSGATIKNGQVVDVAGSGARPVTMIDRTGQAVAVPSAIGDDGSSFTVMRSHSGA